MRKSIKLDNYYQELLKNKKTELNHRISKFETANGEIIKDPIYQKISERTNFSMLLHERPLYLIGKSLLLENKTLYNKALTLYSTRNKIVHWGEPDGSNKKNFLPLTNKGAIDAFLIANEIFKWMGINEFNHIYGKNRFVEF